MTERRTYNHPSEIGKKSPLEIFRSCLDLHGDFIREIHQTSQEDFDFISAYIVEHIDKNTKYFAHFDVGRFKIYLNNKVRDGRDKIKNFNPKDTHIVERKKSKKETPKFSMNGSDVYNKTGKASKKETIKKVEEIKKRVEETTKKEPETETHTNKVSLKNCESCHYDKPVEEFRRVRGGARVRNCKSCESRIRKERKEAENQGNQPTTESTKDEKLLSTETGEGLYFIAAILKDKENGELSHVTDQIHSDGPECAIGQFVLREDVQKEIIISIGYEKAVFNKSV